MTEVGMEAPFPMGCPSQWLNMAGILKPAHSGKIHDSSDGDSSLKNTRWPCQNFLVMALPFKMTTFNFPHLFPFTQSQTYLTVWQCLPLVAPTSLTHTGVSPHKSLAGVVLSWNLFLGQFEIIGYLNSLYLLKLSGCKLEIIYNLVIMQTRWYYLIAHGLYTSSIYYYAAAKLHNSGTDSFSYHFCSNYTLNLYCPLHLLIPNSYITSLNHY